MGQGTGGSCVSLQANKPFTPPVKVRIMLLIYFFFFFHTNSYKPENKTGFLSKGIEVKIQKARDKATPLMTGLTGNIVVFLVSKK